MRIRRKMLRYCCLTQHDLKSPIGTTFNQVESAGGTKFQLPNLHKTARRVFSIASEFGSMESARSAHARPNFRPALRTNACQARLLSSEAEISCSAMSSVQGETVSMPVSFS